jgi:N-acetylglucosaminyl-diphospho-decaprenol L-rhamnosyltransferase
MAASFGGLPALFVSYAGVLGGAERLLLDVAGGLAETPSLACPGGPLAERARAAGLHVIELRERPLELRASARDRVAAPLRIAAHARELRSLVRAVRPDLLVAWGMRPLLAAAALGRTRPQLLFQHNDLMPGPGIARAVRSAARRADAVCTPSECVARELGLPARVINPGVDLARFQPAPLPDGPPEVLVLGAIVRWKRPDLALEAISTLPDLRLRIAGHSLSAEGERLLEALRRRAAQPDLEGRVEFAGPADAADALARATCLLHCAEREPYGMVVAEALAAGRAAVVPASCGPAEIVDESCGRLYPPGDAEAAARAVVDVVRNASQLGEAARRRAEEQYDVGETRRRYGALVEEVSGAGSRASGVGNGLALVTVTHNSERDLPRLLASVRAHLPGARVVVVDSGSSDGSAEFARSLGAHVIEIGENVGFGRATNTGVAEVEEPVSVLLNPDVELVDDSLTLLADELRRSDRILAPLVLLPDGSRQDSAQAEPGSAATAAIALIPPALMPPPLQARACPWTSSRARRVGWAVGCCVAARTETLRKLGPFDERTFMYGEDLELGLRAADQGVETWFQPAARVIHYGAHSTEPAFGGEPFELLARQRRRIVAERRGRRRARIDHLLQATTFANRIALKTLAGRNTRRERRQLQALRKASR